MVRTSTVVSLALAALIAGCAGQQVPQHTGYKGKKPTPWTKATAIQLDEEFAAKAEGELDYGAYKRAKWYSLALPGAGELTLDLEVVPSGDAEMDVAMEVLDKNFKVIARADLDADDANEQKKQRKVPDLHEETYYIHLYLQGRVDAADYELKLKFARGTEPWRSDFPQQVAYLEELPAVPPLDDTPIAPPKPVKPTKPGKPRPPKPEDPPPSTGAQPLSADISDIQPDANGSKLVIAAGTSDGVGDGMKGSVPGIKLNTFTLFGCNANRCFAKVKAAPDDVRTVGNVIIRP